MYEEIIRHLMKWELGLMIFFGLIFLDEEKVEMLQRRKALLGERLSNAASGKGLRGGKQ